MRDFRQCRMLGLYRLRSMDLFCVVLGLSGACSMSLVAWVDLCASP